MNALSAPLASDQSDWIVKSNCECRQTCNASKLKTKSRIVEGKTSYLRANKICYERIDGWTRARRTRGKKDGGKTSTQHVLQRKHREHPLNPRESRSTTLTRLALVTSFRRWIASSSLRFHSMASPPGQLVGRRQWCDLLLHQHLRLHVKGRESYRKTVPLLLCSMLLVHAGYNYNADMCVVQWWVGGHNSGRHSKES